MRPAANLVALGLVCCGLVFPGHAEESASSEGKTEYRVLGQDRGRVAVVGGVGKVEWEAPCAGTAHDISLLANGNVLVISGPASVVEISPQKQVVWRYDSKPMDGNKAGVEVHACQRLENGLTMIAESGNRRIIEVDKEGTIVREVPLTVKRPSTHSDTRMVRKLESGNYLVCQESDGVVCEYDGSGKVVWSYALDLAGRPASPGHGPEGHGVSVFGAIRMPNGHTLIAAGNGNRVIEVSPEGRTVWSLEHDELPGIRLAWVTTLELLPNGNVIVGNCHAGPGNPQLFEVTREKQVVWKFEDFQTFGNSLAAAQVLGVKGRVIR